MFANYSRVLSVPGSVPFYSSLYFPATTPGVTPVPETTDSCDLGLRWSSGNIQAQLAAWYTMYDDRLATAYDPVQDTTLFRNLGRVDKYGLDGSIAWRPTAETLLNVLDRKSTRLNSSH